MYLHCKLSDDPSQDIHGTQMFLDFYHVMGVNDCVLLFPKNSSEVGKLWETGFCHSIVSPLNNVSR